MVRQRKRLVFLCLFCIFVYALVVACSNKTEAPPSITQPVQRTPSPTQLHSTVYPTATQTLTPVKDEPTSTTALPSATADRQLFEVCSPLAMESIPELFQIVSDPYRPPPASRSEERHHGVDFAHYERKGMKSIEGEAVQAIVNGRVASVIEDRLPYGNMAILETAYAKLPPKLAREIGLKPDNSLYVLYAHLAESPKVTLREEVDCGQKLGIVGKTGYNIVNPHLHLEIRIGPPGATFTEMAFYTTTATQEEMETYKRWRTSGEFQHIDPMVFFTAFQEWNQPKREEN